MRNNSFYFFVSLAWAVLALLPAVTSVPIPVWNAVVDNQPTNPADLASVDRVNSFNEANHRAGEMVDNMVKVVNSNDPKHKAIVDAAFGPNADHAKIKATVEKLNTQQVHIGTTDVANVKDPRLVATTPMTRPNGPAGPIKLGPEFFAGDSSLKDFRAGTLIHEATHQLSHTGDKVNTQDKMIGALEDQKANVKMDNGKPVIGYQYPGPPDPKGVPKSAADLSQKYKDMITNTKDTHNNADSYRVLAHLCSQPGVFRRDNANLFARAFIDADHEEERRWLYARWGESCELPKDYFKKKAAAKAEAAKKTETEKKAGSTAHGHEHGHETTPNTHALTITHQHQQGHETTSKPLHAAGAAQGHEHQHGGAGSQSYLAGDVHGLHAHGNDKPQPGVAHSHSAHSVSGPTSKLHTFRAAAASVMAARPGHLQKASTAPAPHPHVAAPKKTGKK